MAKTLLIPVRSQIIFVGTKLYIDFGRTAAINTINVYQFMGSDTKVVLASQKKHDQNEIRDISDIYDFGTLCKIVSIKALNESIIRVQVSGEAKVKIKKLFNAKFYLDNQDTLYEANEGEEDHIFAEAPNAVFQEGVLVAEYSITKYKSVEEGSPTFQKIEKMWTEIQVQIKQILTNENFNNPTLANQLQELENYDDNEKREKFIGQIIEVLEPAFPLKMRIFKTQTYIEFYKQVLDLLYSVSVIKEIDEDIDKDVRKKLDIQQREFLLRERMKVIRNKLGEEGDNEEKIEEILNSKELKDMIPEDVRVLIKNEKARLKNMMASSPDANIARTYIELLSELPWRKVRRETLDIKKAKTVLNNYHYGLKDVKERIIEFIAVLINNKNANDEGYKKIASLPENEEIDMNLFNKKNGINVSSVKNPAPIITLLGPPGTGKTSLAKAIAEALDRKFIKISLGGIKDEAEIRGHRRTYIGAMPGKLIRAIKKSGVSNPLILLDEVDKMASDYKGDPASAMLEVLDPEQNANFQDHYLEVEYDLSKVMFLATANYYDNIPTPLLDRVELIELNSYTLSEKLNIAKKHLIGKTLSQHSLDKKYFQIDDESLEFLIKHYTLEAGVRSLKRALDKLARKIVVLIIEKKIKSDEYIINKKQIEKLLGTIIFLDEENDKVPQIGSVNGLAYTAFGGSTLAIEVTTFKGKGELKLTGQLKDVMQESAQIAIAYVRSNAKKYGIDFNWDENSIHIHVPEGAVPKDGPSAGVTFTTAIVSALTKKPVSHLIGMTGEITLRGKVLAIGGLKEKSLAAYRLGIKTIFIPKENKRNLVDIPKEVKDSITFIPVSHYDEIFEKIFQKSAK